MIKKILLAISLIALHAQAAEENLPYGAQYFQRNGLIEVDCSQCPTSSSTRIDEFILAYDHRAYHVTNIPSDYTAKDLKHIIIQDYTQSVSNHLAVSPYDCPSEISLGDDRTLGSLEMEGSINFYIGTTENIDHRQEFKWRRFQQKYRLEEFEYEEEEEPSSEESEVLDYMQDNLLNLNEIENQKSVMDIYIEEQKRQNDLQDYLHKNHEEPTQIPEKPNSPSTAPLPNFWTPLR